MKVDLNQFRKRPTFDEVANIVIEDKYKIDLPSRTYIRWEDTQARVQFENFRDATAEAEMTRARRQAVEAQVMAPPTRPRGPRPTSGGAGTLDEFAMDTSSEGERRRRPPPADVVMRDT